MGPSDPGWIEYLGQMSAICSDGVAALEASIDWEPLSNALRGRKTANHTSFLWYRLMAASAALLSDDDMLLASAPRYLGRAIGDTLALRDAGERAAPTDLIAEVCTEIAQRPDVYPETRLFAVVGRLITAELAGDGHQDIALLCQTLEATEQALRASEDYRAPEYVWGATAFDSEHALWLALVRDHFPTKVPQAAQIKQLLLEQGARWIDSGEAEVPVAPADEEVGDPDATVYGLDAVSFFLYGASSTRARTVALRIASDCAELKAEMTRDDDRFSSWLTTMNNAINAAHAHGAFALAAQWADVARPYAGDNPYLPHNLACAYCAVGRTDDAFAMCALAVKMDNPGLEQLRDDDDLGSLRSEPRFVALFSRRGKKD